MEIWNHRLDLKCEANPRELSILTHPTFKTSHANGWIKKLIHDFPYSSLNSANAYNINSWILPMRVLQLLTSKNDGIMKHIEWMTHAKHNILSEDFSLFFIFDILKNMITVEVTVIITATDLTENRKRGWLWGGWGGAYEAVSTNQGQVNRDKSMVDNVVDNRELIILSRKWGPGARFCWLCWPRRQQYSDMMRIRKWRWLR